MTTTWKVRGGRLLALALLVGACVGAPRFAAPAAAQACVGDCSGDGAVGVNELIRGVNIALGLQPLSNCPSFDTDASETVSISELIRGVRAALGLATCLPAATPTPGCPMAAGSYRFTQIEGGTLAVGTIADFPFPAGGAISMDVGEPDGDCVHEVIVPADGGLTAPIFCIAALSFSVDVSQRACGIGRIDSNGGSDYTVTELGDSSDASSTCNLPGCAPGENSAVRVDLTVGDGSADACGTGGIGNAIIAIPVFTTTWSEAAGCPAPDGEYNEDVDTLIVEFPQTLDFTTDTNTATWMDIDGDGCSLAGVGLNSYSAVGDCIDFGAGTVTTAAAGTIGSKGSPLFDITFKTRLLNTVSGPEEPMGATCDPAPVIDFAGEATRCVE